MTEDSHFGEQVQELSALGTVDTIWGIPSTSVVVTASLAVGLGFGAAWWLGLLVGLTGLFGLYQLYQIDPLGPKPWVVRLQSGWRSWRIGRRVDKSLLFIE